MQTIVLKRLFDFIRNNQYHFNVLHQYSDLEENVTLSGIHFSESSLTLHLSNGNSLEIQSSSIDLISYDAIISKDFDLESLNNTLSSFNDHPIKFIHLLHDNQSSWTFCIIR